LRCFFEDFLRVFGAFSRGVLGAFWIKLSDDKPGRRGV